MIPATQSESAVPAPPRLYQLFRFYDAEAIAVMTILVGLFQVILGFPTYYLSVDIRVLYLCPIFVGAVHVVGGSFAFACERSPSRKLLKNCLYSTLSGLLLGFCAIIVYAFAANSITSIEECDQEEIQKYMDGTLCPRDALVEFFRGFALILGIYAVAALILQFLLSVSAIKGLKTH